MKQKMKRFLLIALMLCGTFHAVWADGWKLTNTKVNGTGGYWEDGQKTRIDGSYKKGVFQYERKVTNGAQMDVYSSKAEFAEPKQNYYPGEDISVRVDFSEKGGRLGYAPHAEVSVNGYPAKDAGGRNKVMPPETVTLMAQAPSSGSQMTIVYSCNGMEAVYTYEWVGTYKEELPNEETMVYEEPSIYEETPVFEEIESEEEITPEERIPIVEETEEVFEEERYEPKKETNYKYEYDDEEPEEQIIFISKPLPISRYLIVIGVALLLIALILIIFRKK